MESLLLSVKISLRENGLDIENPDTLKSISAISISAQSVSAQSVTAKCISSRTRRIINKNDSDIYNRYIFISRLNTTINKEPCHVMWFNNS